MEACDDDEESEQKKCPKAHPKKKTERKISRRESKEVMPTKSEKFNIDIEKVLNVIKNETEWIGSQIGKFSDIMGPDIARMKTLTTNLKLSDGVLPI